MALTTEIHGNAEGLKEMRRIKNKLRSIRILKI
jgi:hypothetical protein